MRVDANPKRRLVFPIAVIGVLAAALLACSFSAMVHAEQSAPALLSATTLKEAIAGNAIAHRGVQRSGEASIAFAEGYLTAIAEIATEQGVWCGADNVLPHEVTAQVFDWLNALEAPDDQRAATAVASALAAIFPCTSDSGRWHRAPAGERRLTEET